MTILEAGNQLDAVLFPTYGKAEGSIISDWIMENLSGFKQAERKTKGTSLLSSAQHALLNQYLHQLTMLVPVQYVLQEAWFYKLKLFVNESVLIPRPETEELVEWVVNDFKHLREQPKQLLDIGAGSGCIALAIKKNLPQLAIHACDISREALMVAEKNAATLQLDIKFHLTDILFEKDWQLLPKFDTITSNPPYIPEKDKAEMEAHVLLHEPSLALFVPNEDPLIFYRAIADFGIKHLNKNGSIYVEIQEQFGREVLQLFKEKKYSRIELRKDLQGKDRMVKIKM